MKNILVIDDDAEFAEMVHVALDKERFTVTAAADGLKGLESVKASRPDLILLDIKMPAMDGLEFLRQLRTTEPDTHIPVIVVTNDSSLDTISEGTELGIRSYILKANESMKTIAEAVDRVFTSA